jgi:hypothetical protein
MFKLPYTPVKGERWNSVLLGFAENFAAIETKFNELENKKEDLKMNEKCCNEATVCAETLRERLDRIANLLVTAGAIADTIESKTLRPRPCNPHGTEPRFQEEPPIEDFVDLIGYRIGRICDTLNNINDLL